MKLRSQPPLPPCGRLRLISWLKPRRIRRHKSRRGRRGAEAPPPPVANDRSLFLFTRDWDDGYLIYGVGLEAVPPPAAGDDPPTLMEIRPSADPVVGLKAVPPPAAGDDPPTLEIRPSADPVACWSEDDEHKFDAFAAVSGGLIVALVSGTRGTVIHDTATHTDTPGPRLRRSNSKRRRPSMLPVGDDTVLVMDRFLRPGRRCFEALRRLPGGEWRAGDPLPNPPVAYGDERSGLLHYPFVSAYFARGSRAWISLSDRGTFSLDTELGTWRAEGTWELPLYDRGLFVPELGSVVGVARGLARTTDPEERCCQVCALDVEPGRPPVVRRVWEFPPERAENVVGGADAVSLADLGNGRLCVSRSVVVDVPAGGCGGGTFSERGTSFTLVDVTRLPDGDVHLAEHGKTHYHVWPREYTGHAPFLQSA